MGTSNLDTLALSGDLTVAGNETVTGGLTVTAGITGAVLGQTPVDVTAATVTITAASHGGRVVTLNRAAGIAVTLPAASGSGAAYNFVIGTTVTSNSTTIKVANSSDAMTGTAYVVSDDAGAPVKGYRTAATDDTITFNGTTTGGLKGDIVRVRDVATNLFAVEVLSAATGTEATPFSATV